MFLGLHFPYDYRALSKISLLKGPFTEITVGILHDLHLSRTYTGRTELQHS